MPYFPPVLLRSGAQAGATVQAQVFDFPLLVGTNAPYNPAVQAGIDIISGTGVGVLMANTATDATTKACSFGIRHYTNAEEPMMMVRGSASNGTNALTLGGGSSLWNAATIISLYAAANSTTVTGTEILRLNTGGISVGTAANPTAWVHAAASTTARASFCLPHGVAPTSPNNGDMWTTTAGLFVHINGTTIGPLS